jgi:hypothetical protein
MKLTQNRNLSNEEPRRNGGTVWFDQPGTPWPKHSCSDNSRPFPSNRQQNVGVNLLHVGDPASETRSKDVSVSQNCAAPPIRRAEHATGDVLTSIHLHPEQDRRIDCNCDHDSSCVMCEGSGWLVNHYDGDFTPGRVEDKCANSQEAKQVVKRYERGKCSCGKNRNCSQCKGSGWFVVDNHDENNNCPGWRFSHFVFDQTQRF